MAQNDIQMKIVVITEHESLGNLGTLVYKLSRITKVKLHVVGNNRRLGQLGNIGWPHPCLRDHVISKGCKHNIAYNNS